VGPLDTRRHAEADGGTAQMIKRVFLLIYALKHKLSHVLISKWVARPPHPAKVCFTVLLLNLLSTIHQQFNRF
jgi:hypothetical protein